MALTKLQFKPGIVRDTTRYTNNGGWFDSNRIRFRMGLPETIGGWTRHTNAVILGTCRSLHNWSSLANTAYIGAGTDLKLYITRGGQPFDITPIRVPAGVVTFAATNNSDIITVTATANGAALNDFVTFSGAVSLGGVVTAAVLNKEYQISEIVNPNSYKFVATATANASDTQNGGSNARGAYQINVGLNSVILGTGWGAGPYSGDANPTTGWGDAANVAVAGSSLRLWSQDNWGEDLVANIRGGGIYHWDLSAGVSARGVKLFTGAGVTGQAPQIANVILVSERDRRVIAFGCDPQGAPGVQDPLTIRFSDIQSYTEWRALDTNSAGELRLSTGSEIVTAVQTKQQILVLTDISAHTMQYLGDPFWYGLTEVSVNTSIAGQNAAVAVGDVVYWMGRRKFFMYDGGVKEIPCAVKEYVFDDLDLDQLSKVTAASNAAFSEVWWFYPSQATAVPRNNDKYVVFNYAENVWYYGSLARTAWSDNSNTGYPIAASTDGYIYNHENSINDGSQNPPTALNAYIESSPIELGDGDQYMFAKRLLPDISFRDSTVGTELAILSISERDFPGGSATGDTGSPADSTNTITGQAVGTFTEQLDIRVRSRSIAIRLASKPDLPGVSWRMGTPRIDVRPDGRR
jgi:hypothetical protein